MSAPERAAPVCGLDLSLSATGIACETHTDVLCPPRGCNGMERLAWIRAEVLEHVTQAPLVVLEGYAYGRPSQAHHLGELGGVIRFMLWTNGIPYVEIAPAALKKFATGAGNAPKDRVLSAAIRAGYEGENNNSGDAWWLRQMGLYSLGQSDVGRTTYRNEAIARLAWPDLQQKEDAHAT